MERGMYEGWAGWSGEKDEDDPGETCMQAKVTSF